MRQTGKGGRLGKLSKPAELHVYPNTGTAAEGWLNESDFRENQRK